jgi:heterodisulfide reductase subunit B
VNRIGVDTLAKQTKRPLSGLKLVCYYGCLLTRPPEITGADNPEYPMSMDRLLRALGAETLDWSYKTDCCGGSLSIIDTDKCLDLIQRILDNARAVGADAIAVACPMCHANLDSRQAGLAKREGRAYDMPVLYFTQLMALALGLGPKGAAVDGHLVDVRPLLRARGLLD